MRNYQVAIVEDEQSYVDTLTAHLNKYAESNDIKFTIKTYVDGYNLLDDYKCQYDILFLDIELIQLNGFKTAEEVRKKDEDVIIVFVTNLINFAVKGYDVDAQSFLVKPVSYFKFNREIQKIIKKISNQNAQFIIISTDNGLKKIETSQIIYIESKKHELIINTTTEQYSIWASLKEYEQKLAPFHFFRCNNSYIVNLAKIRGIEEDYVLIENEHLKISRARKKDFLNTLTDYYKEGL